jgi:hypothetical protein
VPTLTSLPRHRSREARPAWFLTFATRVYSLKSEKANSPSLNDLCSPGKMSRTELQPLAPEEMASQALSRMPDSSLFPVQSTKCLRSWSSVAVVMPETGDPRHPSFFNSKPLSPLDTPERPASSSGCRRPVIYKGTPESLILKIQQFSRWQVY